MRLGLGRGILAGGAVGVMGAAMLLLAGCHGAVVSATIRNESGAPIKMVELDYPSASFGVNSIAPGAEFHYQFEVHGSKALHLSYTDTTEAAHVADGPVLSDGDKSPIRVIIGTGGHVEWQK